MTTKTLFRVGLLASLFGPLAVAAGFQLNLISITNSQPGQMPKVVFSVTDPANSLPYDIKAHPAFTSSTVSRLTVHLGWDTVDFHNTGSGSESATPPAAALPISVNALSGSYANGDGTFTVVSTKAIPATATGTGAAFLEGRMAAQDVTGAWSIQVPVKGAYQTFVITGTTAVARRQVVDRNRCRTCHTVLTVHGNQRTDELKGCVICHNPNATDIPYRQYGDGPEVPINFPYLVHSIHRGSTRTTPFRVMGFGHTLNDFSAVTLADPPVRTCEACHIPGAYSLPLPSTIPGTTVSTQSILTATQKTVDNDPANNLRMTPAVSICSACHDSQLSKDHMVQYGGSFSVLQQSINSGTVKEQCNSCHAQGQAKDLFSVHNEPAPYPRLSALSVNSGVLGTSVPVTITGANLNGASVMVGGTGVTASSVAISSNGTQITAVLNIAANAVLGRHVIQVSTYLTTTEGLAFNVVPPAPTLSSVAPNGGAAGTVVAVTVSGTNLSGATLAANASAVAVSNVATSASQITATLSIGATATAGPVILTATTSGGLSNGVIFNVGAAAPSDFSMSASPAGQSVTAGGSASYTVNVTPVNGFAGGVAFSVSGMPTGVSASFNPTSVSSSGSTVMTLASTATATSGTYPLTITGTSGSLIHTASASLTITAPGVGGSLSGSLMAPPATVQLTSEGTLDWAHWGLNTAADFDHKAGVTQKISNFTSVGSGTVSRYGNNSSGFTWTDGTPSPTATNSTTGVFVSGQNNGFRITAPADTTTRTLRIYVGVWHSQGQLTAQLSDGSAPVFTDSSIINTVSPTSLGVYTLTYRAGSAGQTLTVTFVQSAAGSGNVTLQAATLATIAAPDFTLSATPSSQSVTAGGAALYSVAVAAQNGFSGSVGLSISGLPAGVTPAFSPGSVSGGGSSTLTLTTASGTAAGTYPLIVTGISGGLSHTANVSLTITTTVTGSLSGSMATTPATVQLTEGTLDWAHWGLNTAADFDHKAGVAQQISNITPVGTATVSRYANNSAAFTWTDGIPNATATNSTTGVFINGMTSVNSGFQITVPAGTTVRTLKVYVGAWHTGSRLVAHLSDGSAPDYVDSSLVNTVSPTGLGVYTLSFRAASSGQVLTVTFTNTTSAGNVTIQAATLAP